MTKRQDLKLEDIEKALIKFYKDNKTSLEGISPYKDIDLDGIIDEFLDAIDPIDPIDPIKDNKEFSWIEKFLGDEEKNSLVKGKEAYANLNYNIPTHIHGDYQNGLIYLCLLNPSSKIADDKKYNDKNINDQGIEFYYTKMIKENSERKKNKKNKEIKLYKEKIYEIIDKWQNGEAEKNNVKNEIVREIIDDKTSILTKELNYEKGIGRYYYDNYFKQLLDNEYGEKIIKKNKDYEKISNKIVNIELYPFRSTKAGNLKSKFNDNNFSEFSAKIILHRIGKYLAENEEETVTKVKRPIFIFRSYKNWEDKFVDCIYELMKEYSKKKIEKCMLEFRAKYFYKFNGQSASMSQKNILKFLADDEYNEILDNLRE